MEIYCDVWLDNPITKEKIHTNEGIYTFVAVDKNNKPVAVPEAIPETEEENLATKRFKKKRTFFNLIWKNETCRFCRIEKNYLFNT
jgi:acyl-CoA hydrolase